MKHTALLVLALLAFSLVPLVQVVHADTPGQGLSSPTGWNSWFGTSKTLYLTGTDWIFGPVTPSPTPEGGPQWFPGGETFNHTPLPKRPDMNYSAFYSLLKPNSTGFTLPSPYPTPKVVPVRTLPTPRPMPTWTIPAPGTIPTESPTYTLTPTVTPIPEGPVVLTELNLVQDYVKIRNTGKDRVDLTGWRLCDRAGHCINFIEWENGYRFELLPFSTLTIYSGQEGNPSSTRLYWPDEMWNDRGDTASLYDAGGTLVSTITK
jgi:hypothetical protein